MRTSLQPGTGTAPATPQPQPAKPWRTALAGLLLLGTAGGLMAYGAPSHASTRSPSPHSAVAYTTVDANGRIYFASPGPPALP
jgi:hypothetical protein